MKQKDEQRLASAGGWGNESYCLMGTVPVCDDEKFQRWMVVMVAQTRMYLMPLNHNT